MQVESSDQSVQFHYRILFESGEEKQFDIFLNKETLEIHHHPMEKKPEWTKLSYCQCENCPLKDIDDCPVALNIAQLVEEFKFSVSYDKVKVQVETPERMYSQETTAQYAISAILGIYMVTSNCPILDYLRPMVRFHLPFATPTETVFRAVSMYLVAQHFRYRHGNKPDWTLEGLEKIYNEVAIVNKGMWGRLSKASTYDANVNALIVLNTFGDALRSSLDKDLEGLIPLFKKYLD